MAVFLTAAEAAKYKSSVFYLQCKPHQDLVIRCNKEERFDVAAAADALGYAVDSSGNISAAFHRGQSGYYEGDEFKVNDLYDLDVFYSPKDHCWRLTIAIEKSEKSDYCQIKGLKIAIPLFLSGPTEIVMRFACHACQSCIESMLAIDLGNTRSCILLCDDVRNTTHASGIQLRKVPLLSYTDNKISDEGVCDSFVSFSEVAGSSFTRIGKEAIPVANNLRGSRESGDFYLSSPKRYYWDDDENLNGWKVLYGRNQAKSLETLPMARELAKGFPLAQAGTMPRSSILAGMFMEILEQAESYINNAEFYSLNKLPKLLTHVCLTFPAGWSTAEREKYYKVLEQALKLYTSQRCGNKTITLDVSCDEASAVLLCYIYGEITKYSGRVDSWLEAIGRTDPLGGGTHARIAVIDVGGGTSDLAIVDLQNMKKSSSECHLQMDKLYKDGTSKAGDLMLRNVVKKILMPRVAAGIVSDNAPKDVKNQFIERFGAILNNLSSDPRVKQLSRRFWFPLAIDFLQAVNSNSLRDVHLPDSLPMLMEILKDHAEDTISNNLNDDFSLINVTDNDKTVVRKIVTQTFRETAKLFGAAIYAFDADIVILSGKTTENSEVARIFQKYSYLPKARFIPMWNYMIGDWCTVADAGRINDSKYTTAIGAALYSIINQHYPIQNIDALIETKNVAGINDGNCFWGIASNGNFEVKDAIMSPGHSECWVPFSGHPKLLARRRFNVDSSEIAISYELRMKPFKQQLFDWQEKLTRYQYDMNRIFAVTCDDISLETGDYLLVRKNKKELKSENIKVTLGRDHTDDSRTAVVIRMLEGVYEDGSMISTDDVLLLLKPRDRVLQQSVEVKLQLHSDVYGRADITIEEVNGKYNDGSLVMPEDLELRIKTSDEGLFWLDSGKI